MGATVEKTQAERLRSHRKTSSHPGGETDVPSGLRLDSSAGLRGAPRRGFSLVGGRRSYGESRSVWSCARVPHGPGFPPEPLTCVPGALSGCGVSGSAAPVCWMNCCRLH